MFLQVLQVLYVLAVVLLLFNLTIFVHELGHYWVGRRRGAKIDRFAIWFGPAIWSKTIRGVEFRLGCVPLGGYVLFPQLAIEAIEGKSETPAEEIEPLMPRDKIPILFAGSIANVFLGFAVACVVWLVGLPKDASDLNLKVGHVPVNTPEREAGIRPGDQIVSVNGETVRDWDEILHRVALSLSQKVRVGLERDGVLRVAEVVPGRDHLFRIRRLNLEPASTPVATQIQPKSPAEKAGIQPGDEFMEVDGEKVLGARHLIEMIGARGNKPTQITLLRNNQRIQLEIIPKFEKNSKFPRIGVPLRPKEDEQKILVYPTPQAQITQSLLLMADTLNALMHPRTTGVGVGDLAGPVGIGWSLYARIKTDFRLALHFLVILNINLAVVNLLPIPVLDGGHIVFALIEAIRRKPLNVRFMEATQTVFVVALLGFMAYVTFNDISRLMRFGALTSKEKHAADSSVLPAFEERPSR